MPRGFRTMFESDSNPVPQKNSAVLIYTKVGPVVNGCVLLCNFQLLISRPYDSGDLSYECKLIQTP